MIFQLGWIRDGLAVLPHISQGPGEQVGVPFLAEAKNHRGAHIKRVAGSLETAAAASRNQIALEHQHLGPFGGQLAGGDQPANAGAELHLDNAKGEIVSDFEVEVAQNKPVIERDEDEDGVSIRVESVIVATVNGGGPVIRLKTLNGNIQINKSGS